MRSDFTAGMLVAKEVDAVNFSSVYDYVFSVFDIICHAFSDLDPGIFVARHLQTSHVSIENLDSICLNQD
jgi:hypothetical protein